MTTTNTPAAPPPLDANAAQRELSRRHARAIASLAVRVILLSTLTALVGVQAPAMRPYRGFFDMMSGILALWPFFTATGQAHALRIRWGSRLADSGQWQDAARLLMPLAGFRGRLFDATGEGRARLAQSLDALGRPDAARRLWHDLAQSPGAQTAWGKQAQDTLANPKETP